MPYYGHNSGKDRALTPILRAALCKVKKISLFAEEF